MTATTTTRLESLDQFRGYTVLGMFVVNFLGGLKNVHPNLLHHHTFVSYADTIMPQFLFAVGMGMRLSFLRREAQVGWASTMLHFLTRAAGLIFLGCVVYHLTGQYKTWHDLISQDFSHFLSQSIKRQPFEALTHIGVTILWVLPVISSSTWVRVAFALVSAGLHVTLSLNGYYTWNMTPPVGIDGGPLGFLTWTIPLIAGTLVHDWMSQPRTLLFKTVCMGMLLMILGVCLSQYFHPHASWPFNLPAEKPELNYWLMSQRSGSVTYLLFGAGFACLIMALFHLIVDIGQKRLAYLGLLGRHALAGYLIHDLASGVVKPFVPKDSPAWWATGMLLCYLLIITIILRYLDRHRYYLKL